MSLTILVPTPETPAKRRKAAEAPARPWYRPLGGWIADGVGLRQMITLCDSCDGRFNPRKAGYELFRRSFGTTGPYVVADCWGCSTKWSKCKAYIHASFHDAIGDESRQRGRWVTLASQGWPGSR